jgi:hypothetical protein
LLRRPTSLTGRAIHITIHTARLLRKQFFAT